MQRKWTSNTPRPYGLRGQIPRAHTDRAVKYAAPIRIARSNTPRPYRQRNIYNRATALGPAEFAFSGFTWYDRREMQIRSFFDGRTLAEALPHGVYRFTQHPVGKPAKSVLYNPSLHATV